MKITDAKYEGGKLILSTTDSQAKRFAYKFKPGDYEIKAAKQKRSLDANAYCWSLCAQIADVVGITKEEVYRNAIKEGNQYMPITLSPDAVDTFCRVWSERGIGWVTEIVDGTNDGILVFAYYGSSVYDTKQMSDLIDRLIQDAKALDIDVISESEKALLLEEWH